MLQKKRVFFNAAFFNKKTYKKSGCNTRGKARYQYEARAVRLDIDTQAGTIRPQTIRPRFESLVRLF